MFFFKQNEPTYQRFWCLFVFLVLMKCALYAQYPGMLKPTKILNKDTGLPDEYITCMVQDSMGYMWIGTPVGLCRFDGREIKTWIHLDYDTNSLSNNWIISLYYDKNKHELWVGTAHGLNILDLESEKFRKPLVDLENDFDLTEQWITGIFCDEQNDYWIYNTGLHHYDPYTHKLTPYHNNYNAQTNLITLLLQDKFNEDIFWLATMGGYVKFNKKTRQFEGNYFYKSKNKRVKNTANQVELCMYQHDDGRIFGGGLNGGLTILNTVTGEVSLFRPEWKDQKFSNELHYKSIVRENKNLLCISTEIGMVWYNPTTDKVLNFLPSTGYLFKTITPSIVDEDQRIWISSSNGIDIYDPYFNQFTAYDFDAEIMPDKFITIKLIEDTNSGQLYFIENGAKEVYSFDLKTDLYTPPLGNVKEYSLLNNTQDLRTVDILLNQDNDLLLLTKSDVYKYKNKHWENMDIAPQLDVPPYISFFEGQKRDLFLLSSVQGVFHLRFPEFEVTDHFGKDAFKLNGAWLKNGFYDKKGKLWLNHLSAGFSVYDIQNKDLDIAFLDNNKPLGISRVKDEVWLNDSLLLVCGGVEGLGLIHRDKHEKGVFKRFFPGINGLMSDRVYAFEKDENERIWMLADIGVQVYDPKTDQFQFFSYPKSNFNIKSDLMDQAVLEQLEDGRMVFPYSKGLVFFNPNTLFRNSEQVIPLFSSIHILDQKIDPIYFENHDLNLAYNENYITFSFSSIGFTAPDKNTFKYKLNGIDEKWVTSTSNEVKYAHLPSGNYVFSLKAANNDFVWSDKTATISFAINPPWWQTWWAKSAYVISILGLFFYWYDNKKKKWKLATEIEVQKEKVQTLHNQKKVELLNAIISGEEKERIRLSRELHDSVGAMISSIKMYFQTLTNNNPFLESDKTFNGTKKLISDTYNEVRNISHNLMPFDIYELGLEVVLKNLCDKYNENSVIEISYQFFVENIPIDEEVQLNLYRIVQEILKNTFIHANATAVFLQLSIDETSIHLEIENDGDVFDVEKAMTAQGIGFKNLATRARYIKGELNIISNENTGTVFSVHINKTT